MKTAISFGILVLGVLLLLVSTLWSTLFPGTSSWTEEKAKRSTEIKARLSDLGPRINPPKPNMHRGPDPATLKAEFDALVKEDQELNADFESARDNPKRTSSFLKWSGIGLAIVGLIGWYAVNQSS